MAITMKNCCVEHENYSLLANWPDWGLNLSICSDSRLICLFISLLVPLRRALWSAFGLPRILSFSHSASLALCISACCCSETQLQKAFSRNAGPRKKWPVPQLTEAQGYGVGAMKSSLHSATLQKSFFALIQKSVNSTEIFNLGWEEKRSEMTVNHELETRKINSGEKKGGATKCWSLVVQLSFFLSIFLDFSSTTFEISLFLCSPVRRLNLVAVHSWFRFEEFLYEMAISLKNCRVKQQNHTFLVKLNWLSARFS